jgi:hypothetical protein
MCNSKNLHGTRSRFSKNDFKGKTNQRKLTNPWLAFDSIAMRSLHKPQQRTFELLKIGTPKTFLPSFIKRDCF